MPTLLDRMVQIILAAPERQAGCRRAVCRRYRRCVPPRHAEQPALFRCPFELGGEWVERVERAEVLARRLMKLTEQRRAARGLPSPFRPAPRPDPFDLTKPFDVVDLMSHPVDPALLSQEKEGSARRKRP